MDSGSSGERANDGERPRDDEQAGADLRAQAKSDASPRRKDYLVNDTIGKALQAHYSSLVAAPLPDRFLILLAELEAKDSDDHR